MEKSKKMKDKYVIIDLRNMDYMKDEDKNFVFYDTEQEAGEVCGMYEFENAWILKLVYNYIDVDYSRDAKDEDIDEINDWIDNGTT